MRRFSFHSAAAGVLAAVFASIPLDAWAVSPSLTTILPRGGQRGTEVEVRFIGSNLGDAVDVMFHEPGIELVEITEKTAKEVNARLKIAPECAVGTKALRVRTDTGVSNLELFSVGNLPELQEAEPNSEVEAPQPIAFGQTVNGAVTNEDVDYFAVDVEAGAQIAVEVEALRLGTSLFDAKVRLFGPHGHELVASDDTAFARQDPAFVYAAEEGGRYLIAVSEAAYGGAGDYYYRLHVGPFPRPLSVTPLGGKSGAETTVTWLGDPRIGTETIVMPAVAGATHFHAPALDSGVAPTPAALRVIDYDGVVESEPNDAREQATPGAVPGAFDGVINEENDYDWFQFEGTKGQVFDVRVWARELGSPLDSVVRVVSPSGKNLESNDDSGGMDSRMRIELAEDGTHSLVVRDHLRNGGPLYTYRVEVLPVRPQIELSAEKNEPASLAVPRSNRALLLVQAIKREFDGELTFQFPNLPAGVTVDHGALSAGQSILPVLFNASADAAVSGTMLDTLATHAREAGDITGGIHHRIRMVLGRNQTVFHEYWPDRFALAVTNEAPFTLEIQQPQVPVIKGSNMRLRIVAHRSEGFNEPIKVRMPWVPPNFGAGTAKIESDTSEVELLLEANGNAAAGAHQLVAVGESAGWEVATPFTPVEVSEPWVQFAMNELHLEQGQETEVPITVTQAKPFEGTFQVKLVGLPKGVEADPQEFTKDSKELKIPLKAAADAPEGKHGVLRFVATIQANEEPVLHFSRGAELRVFKPLPPKVQEKTAAAEPEKRAEEPEKPKRRTRFPEPAK